MVDTYLGKDDQCKPWGGDCLNGSCVKTANDTYQCVPACTTNADCVLSGAASGRNTCDTVSHSCVACVSAAQCTTTADNGQAQPSCSGGQCIYCGAEGLACDKGFVCTPSTYTCHKGCNVDSDCPANNYCVDTTGGDGATLGVCAPCKPVTTSTTAPTCPKTTPYCAPNTKAGTAYKCVECTADPNCSAGFTCDISTSTCVAPGGAGAFTASMLVAQGAFMQGKFLVAGVVQKLPPDDSATTSFTAFSTDAIAGSLFAIPHVSKDKWPSETMSGNPDPTFIFIPSSGTGNTGDFAIAAYTYTSSKSQYAVLARSCVNSKMVELPIGPKGPATVGDVLRTVAGNSACSTLGADWEPLAMPKYARGAKTSTGTPPYTKNFNTVNGFLTLSSKDVTAASVASNYAIFQCVKADGSVVEVDGVKVPPVIASPTHGTVCHIAMKPPVSAAGVSDASETLYMGIDPSAGLGWVTLANIAQALTINLSHTVG